MVITLLERLIGLFAGIGIFAALGVIFHGIWRGASRPIGRGTPQAGRILRIWVYVILGVFFFGACAIIWKPLPLSISVLTRSLVLLLGIILFASGLTLVLWGRLTLGRLYNVSSALGAQLFADHQLITEGPYAFVRHPMYLGVELISLGGLLIYRTWTMVFLSIVFLGLFFRARREEEVLAAEFGPQWDSYCRKVPAWFPRFRHRGRKKLSG